MRTSDDVESQITWTILGFCRNTCLQMVPLLPPCAIATGVHFHKLWIRTLIFILIYVIILYQYNNIILIRKWHGVSDKQGKKQCVDLCHKKATSTSYKSVPASFLYQSYQINGEVYAQEISLLLRCMGTNSRLAGNSSEMCFLYLVISSFHQNAIKLH